MKYSFPILILIVATICINDGYGQNKPDYQVVKTTIPENSVVSIKNDIYNPDAPTLKKELKPEDGKTTSYRGTKPNLTKVNKDLFGLDAFHTLIGYDNYPFNCSSVATERTGVDAGTIWVVASVSDLQLSNDRIQIYRFNGIDWELKTTMPIGGFMESSIDAELIEHESGNKFLWFVVQRNNPNSWKAEVYYGVYELGTTNAYWGKLEWPGAGPDNEYYNPRITSDNYVYPDIPWLYVVASLDSITTDNKHVYAQMFAYVSKPYDMSEMQIHCRPDILPVFWPNGGTTDLHYLYSDIAYFKTSTNEDKIIITYSNVPDDTKIWLTNCQVYGSGAVFAGTISGHGNYRISTSAISSTNSEGSLQLMAVFEENYMNSGDWDLVSARSNDAGATWSLNYIESTSSTTDIFPRLGALVSRSGTENEYYVSYRILAVPTDSIMSIKSNGGNTSYWDNPVKMNDLPPDPPLPAIGITNTPGERITVWSRIFQPAVPPYFLYGSFWPNLPSAVDDETEINPNSFELFQNYPNPFNPATKISWYSHVGEHQTLKVYDILGNEVAKLIDEYLPAGTHEVDFDASYLSSGVYFYKMQAGNYISSKKMVLIR